MSRTRIKINRSTLLRKVHTVFRIGISSYGAILSAPWKPKFQQVLFGILVHRKFLSIFLFSNFFFYQDRLSILKFRNLTLITDTTILNYRFRINGIFHAFTVLRRRCLSREKIFCYCNMTVSVAATWKTRYCNMIIIIIIYRHAATRCLSRCSYMSVHVVATGYFFRMWAGLYNVLCSWNRYNSLSFYRSLNFSAFYR